MQTGSGKTHTMLGEIEDLEFKPSPHRGITPRIFEFLFARIHAVIVSFLQSSHNMQWLKVISDTILFIFQEEEIRLHEKLKYNCKCSFLEIYNEQITDLLDPSSTNLLVRSTNAIF